MDLSSLPVLHRADIPETYLDEMGHMNVMWYTHLFSEGALVSVSTRRHDPRALHGQPDRDVRSGPAPLTFGVRRMAKTGSSSSPKWDRKNATAMGPGCYRIRSSSRAGA